MRDWPEIERDREWGRVEALAGALAGLDRAIDASPCWPAEAWALVQASEAHTWSLPPAPGTSVGDRATILQRYGKLAEGSLTVAFILTQHDAAVRRLVAGLPHDQASHWLAEIGAARAFATVGLSQLTTSRRLGSAALRAKADATGGFVINGVIPWVTGAEQAQIVVAGAVLEDGSQILFILPTQSSGVRVAPAFELAALDASRTTEITCEDVHIDGAAVLAGPSLDVMKTPGLTGTGGLETSALALGQARAALVALQEEISARGADPHAANTLVARWARLAGALLSAAHGIEDAPDPTDLRAQCNSLALRATQAFLTARKGTGFLKRDSAQRWARQALFFLVWSCPGPVAQAAMREFAEGCSP